MSKAPPKTNQTKNNAAIESGSNAKKKRVGVRAKSAGEPDDQPTKKRQKRFGKVLMDEDITKERVKNRKSTRAPVPKKRD